MTTAISTKIYALICKAAKSKAVCPSNSQIAWDAGCSQHQARIALDHLIATKKILVQRAGPSGIKRRFNCKAGLTGWTSTRPRHNTRHWPMNAPTLMPHHSYCAGAVAAAMGNGRFTDTPRAAKNVGLVRLQCESPISLTGNAAAMCAP